VIEREIKSDLLDSPRGQQENSILNAAINMLFQNNNIEMEMGESTPRTFNDSNPLKGSSLQL
jgi:hypothetical protein